jgi:hypothetical protein
MKFKTNTTYKSRSICNHDSVFAWTIVKVSEKSVWLKGDLVEGIKRCKIKTFSDNSGVFVEPLGTYSMSPTIRPTSNTDY